MNKEASKTIAKAPAPKAYKTIIDSGANKTIVRPGWLITAKHKDSTRCEGFFGEKSQTPRVDATSLLLDGTTGEPIGLLVCYDVYYFQNAKGESAISTCQMEHSMIEVNAKQ